MRLDPSIPLACEHCGTMYFPHPSNRGRFCSRRCAVHARILPLEDRLRPKIARNDAPDACWPWTGACDRDGYGLIRIDGKLERVTRIVYESKHGPLPSGLLIRHTCDNPPCVRDEHLLPGTYADNSADMVSRDRQATGERHGSRTRPERVPRGERHGSRTKPGRMPMGDLNPSRLHPESLPRGERNGRYTKPERTARGEQNGQATLTTEQVVVIRARYARGGVSLAALAREFGVGKSTIYRIVSGESWKHLMPA